MTKVLFPTIDLRATGENIIRLRKANGFTVRELQHYFGFEEPQAIYKWQQGKCLPSVDNLYALSRLFGVSMNEILVQSQSNLISNGQSDDCPFYFKRHLPRCRKAPTGTQNHKAFNPFRSVSKRKRKKPAQAFEKLLFVKKISLSERIGWYVSEK